ncbi:hypothetical protein SEA_JORDENNIS_61 [Mycobacterium phage Jordennis]|uniref:Uncharacterized protein n=1 Tax=Mycobacterium phage Priamo TaxID=2182403 RepID=A0A2U8UQU8_9CAUD|nr:hypothetical protein KIP55_gp046 [Mycobacterium phage Priamo]AWN05826.1 hypothetical protein SEA_PRIAMO_64 [Mycobacterium phage Priamo]QBP28961.1 hypothetical protein SEA_JORDENNIS_61 [Mycobacterium phage Jordennis]
MDKHYRIDFVVGAEDMDQEELFELITDSLLAHGVSIHEGSAYEVTHFG